MAERNIIAYFHSPDQAQSIVPKLQALRGTGISVDRVGRNEDTGVGVSDRVINGDFPGLPYLSLGEGGQIDRDSSILLAADPDASGMSGSPFGPNSNEILDTLLTVSVDEGSYEQAVRVIEEAGGRV